MKKFDFKRIGLRIAGVTAGAAAGTLANKPLVNMNPKLRGVIKIGIGAILPELAPKGDFLKDVGAGIIATGAVDLLGAFAPALVSGLDGIGEVGETASDFVNGIGADDMVNGSEDYLITESVNGTDDAMGTDDEVIGTNDDAMGEICDDNMAY